MNKGGILGLIGIVIILLVVGLTWFVGEVEEGDLEGDEVEKCVRVQTGCCPCNMGGKEKCVLASEAEEIGKNLSECSASMTCAAVFSCEIESCEYVEGECVAT